MDGEKENQIQSRLLLERVIKPLILNLGVNFEVNSSNSENFEIVILSDKNGMYLMTGRKWEWRLTVVDYKSNEP